MNTGINTMKNRTLWIALIIALLGVLLWLAFFWEPVTQQAEGQAHAQLPVAETPAGGDFVLQSPTGAVSLADYRGKIVILYFGYTFCPDVCPTSLAVIAQALSALTPVELEKVRGFMISVDPERDTMDVLKSMRPISTPTSPVSAARRSRLPRSPGSMVPVT